MAASFGGPPRCVKFNDEDKTWTAEETVGLCESCQVAEQDEGVKRTRGGGEKMKIPTKELTMRWSELDVETKRECPCSCLSFGSEVGDSTTKAKIWTLSRARSVAEPRRSYSSRYS